MKLSIMGPQETLFRLKRLNALTKELQEHQARLNNKPQRIQATHSEIEMKEI